MGVDCPTCGQECATENGMKNHHAKIHDQSLARVEVTCPTCADTFEEYESQLGVFGSNRYCSRGCYEQMRSMRQSGKDLEEIIGEEAIAERWLALMRYRWLHPEEGNRVGTTLG